MYMGFMKMGLSMMGLFLLVIVLGYMLETAIFLFVSLTLWFFSFFHVHHLSSLKDVDFEQIKDVFIFGDEIFGDEIFANHDLNREKYRKWGGYLLIGAGILMLWNLVMSLLGQSIDYFAEPIRRAFFYIRVTVPALVFAILLIWVGVKLIKGKQRTLFKEEPPSSLPDNETDN